MKVEITEKVKFSIWSKRTREEFKADHFVNSREFLSGSKLLISETNDCVVRAFACALGISYDEAHAWVAKHLGRKNGKGTYTSIYMGNILNRVKNGYRVTYLGATPEYKFICPNRGTTLRNPRYKNKKSGYTLKAFMNDHLTGRYVIIVEGHAVALVDGVLYANAGEKYRGLYRSVHYVFACK